MACEIDKFNMKPWNPPAPALALAGAVPRSQSVCPIAPYATPVLSWPVQLAKSCRREPVWLRRGLFGCDQSLFLLFSCDAAAVARSGAATAVCRGGGLPLCGLSGGLLGYDHSFIVLLLFNCDAAAVGRGGGLPLCGLSAGVAWAICMHPLSFADHTLARFLGMCVPMMVPLRTLNSLPQIFLWSICP